MKIALKLKNNICRKLVSDWPEGIQEERGLEFAWTYTKHRKRLYSSGNDAEDNKTEKKRKTFTIQIEFNWRDTVGWTVLRQWGIEASKDKEITSKTENNEKDIFFYKECLDAWATLNKFPYYRTRMLLR